jgi:ribose transport system ATP-binding protein
VLRDGEVVATGAVLDLTHDRLIELIVGRTISDLSSASHQHAGESVLEVSNLWGRHLEQFDLTVRQGEVVGIAGLVGSGRDELAMLLFGAADSSAGTVSLVGSGTPSDPQDSIAMGMALVPAERKRYGSIASQSISQNITLARLRPLFRRGKLSRSVEAAEVLSWVNRVELRPAAPERPFETLSGGNQQKAILARWLRTLPRVLVLDEPTQGVDVGAKSAIYALLMDAAAEGAALVVCSSEPEELAAICDRVIVLRNGRAVAELHGTALSPESIVEIMLR